MLIINKLTYKKILELWLNSKKSTIKIQSYFKYQNLINSYIEQYLGDFKINHVKCQNIHNYFEHINYLSSSTKKTILYIIKSSLKYAFENGFIKKEINLNIKIKNPKSKILYFTKNEQNILEKYLNKNMSLYNIGIIICLYTGLRLGEICGLKWEDVDFINNIIYINKTIIRVKNTNNILNKKTILIVSTPKSNSSKRTVPVPHFIMELLKRYKSNNEYYLLTNSNSFKDPRVYQRFFYEILKKCSIRRLSFHTLRHTFATRSIESGMDVKSLSEILGHSTFNITLRTYVHSSIDQKRTCIENLVKYLKIS